MILKSKTSKAGISLLLVLALFAFKIVDLHNYTAKKDRDSGHSYHELCLMGDNHKQHLDFVLPPVFEIEQDEIFVYLKKPQTFSSTKRFFLYIEKNHLNKAPPVLIS